jgi:hypothetical protein
MPGDPCGHGKEAAMRAAGSWSNKARAGISFLAALRIQFTSEDLTDIVGLPNDVGVNANNAVGAVVSAAAAAKEIRRVGYVKCRRRSSHSRVLAVWTGGEA